MRNVFASSLIAVFCLVPVHVASAQSTSAAQAPSNASPTPRKIGFRAYGIVDVVQMSAKKSFAAVLDSGDSTLTNTGVGVEATNLWRGLFARATYSRSSNDGTRVFVDASQTAYSLNVPLTIEIAPMEFGAGWRFDIGNPNQTVRFVPYAGAALLVQRYKETSDFATADENTDTTDTGQALFVGVEMSFKAIKYLKIGLEGQYRNLPDSIGVAGASQAFGESNLGGRVLRLTFGVGF